ncbi:MAG: ATP-binding protein [Oligoflexales bacterium]|nr:ATP-binding protein [Oligoflexales bacterium]
MKRDILTYLYNWLLSKRRKPLVLRGARQVGKSTAVRMFAAEQKLTLYEINLERHPVLEKIFATLDVALIRSHLEGILKRQIDERGSLLFLDEVQATPHALAALRYFYEEWPDLAVIAAGSLLEFTLSEHSFSMPVGRIEYAFIQPLSFSEFLLAKGEQWLLNLLKTYQIESPWASSTHEQLLKLLRVYNLIGGMPEVVAHHCAEPQSQDWKKIQEQIVATYRDDFAKYEKKSQLPLLQTVYDRLPVEIGRKIKSSLIAADKRASQVRSCIYHLAQARLIRPTYHSNADGVPIGAQIDDKIFKVYWLDVGLLNRMVGLDLPLVGTDESIYFKGKLAEQFIAQHLCSIGGSSDRQSLYYWLREGKTGNAEVDFLIQKGTEIIPIEVKSGKSGTMKSLIQFIALHNSNRAVKFSLDMPMIEKACHSTITSKGELQVTFDLYHLPLYFVDELERLLENRDT